MKGIRSLFRLGALAMVAVLLVVALTVPAAAADQTCKKDQMLDEVVILSVRPLESAFTWEASDLLSYGDGNAGKYPTGQLEVEFNDINTAHTITHYDVIATPSNEPGTSDALGIGEVVGQVDRPREVGSVITETLDLQPGTNYDIDVVAYYYSVKISPNQSNQDSLGATTFLSPPFLGGGIDSRNMTESDLSPSDRGVHYLVYLDDEELHTLRWLDPQTFGPFDHKWKVPGDADTDAKGADILCTDEDGDLVDNCYEGDGSSVGITHYRVTVSDENGNTKYIQQIEEDAADAKGVFSAQFNLNDGTYIFSVDAGYVDGSKFYALSDKAQVEFDIPGDYRRYNQDQDEVNALLDDIAETVAGEKDDFDAYYDSDWNFNRYEDDGSSVAKPTPVTVTDFATPGSPTPQEVVTRNNEIAVANVAAEPNREKGLIIFLNNLYN